MVHPLIHFPVKGVIWYQGEANVGRAAEYTDLFYSLISDWRRQWREDFPFYFVQLANFLERKEVQPHSLWAALRESQSQALHLNKTGMVVTLDIGMGDNIHYKNKQEVGRRLALLALSQTYGHHLVGFSPQLKSYEMEGANVKIGFDSTGAGLEVKGTSLKGFTVAGPDHVFHPAVAVLHDDVVTVSSPDVSTPVAVRYGWADNPECTLYGKNGLPVAPFRTDSW
jgi:sialate O-acetylesterase